MRIKVVCIKSHEPSSYRAAFNYNKPIIGKVYNAAYDVVLLEQTQSAYYTINGFWEYKSDFITLEYIHKEFIAVCVSVKPRTGYGFTTQDLIIGKIYNVVETFSAKGLMICVLLFQITE